MRLVRTFILLLVLAVTRFAAPAFVQQAVKSNGTSCLTCTCSNWTVPLTAGNSAILILSLPGTATGASAVLNGGGGESLTKAVADSGIAPGNEIWYVTNVTGGETSASITTSGAGRSLVNCIEFSGLATSQSLITQVNSGVSGTPATGANIIPATASNLIIGSTSWISASGTYSTGPSNSFIRLTGMNNTFVQQESGYLIQSLATPNSTSWTTTDTTPIWVATIAAFNGSIPGPTNAQRGAGFFMPPNEDFDLLNVLHK